MNNRNAVTESLAVTINKLRRTQRCFDKIFSIYETY